MKTSGKKLNDPLTNLTKCFQRLFQSYICVYSCAIFIRMTGIPPFVTDTAPV